MIRKSSISLFFVIIFITAIVTQVRPDEIVIAYPSQAILIASYKGDTEEVMKILATKPDKNVRNTYGDTALHVAVFQNNLSVVKLLLDYGFDPNAKTRKGHTPLHNAVFSNNLTAARLLLQYGANKLSRAQDGITPLELAKREEKREMLMLLSR